MAIKRRKRITLASTLPIFPPRGGGQHRVFHLYRHLVEEFKIDLVTFTNASEPPSDVEIAPGLREVRIAKSEEHAKAEAELSSEVGFIPVTDVVMPQLYHLTPAFLEALRKSATVADYVVASHPYLLPAILEVSDRPIWYEAQDVEYLLKKSILPDNQTGLKLLEDTWRVESECCRVSTIIMVCALEDGRTLNEMYGASLEKIIEVPNGVDIASVRYVSSGERLKEKQRLRLENSFTALFMGSWHEPNLDAVRNICRFAGELPDVNFLIVGSAGLPFENETVPPNVGFMGVVDDETKGVILALADVALNPMVSGSGTNLKMLEYSAAGIPTISTPHGARGLSLENEHHIEIVEIEHFPGAIRALRQDWGNLDARIDRARRFVAARYDWVTIARNFLNEIARAEGKTGVTQPARK